jgi:chromosome segregation ATPase
MTKYILALGAIGFFSAMAFAGGIYFTTPELKDLRIENRQLQEKQRGTSGIYNELDRMQDRAQKAEEREQVLISNIATQIEKLKASETEIEKLTGERDRNYMFYLQEQEKNKKMSTDHSLVLTENGNLKRELDILREELKRLETELEGCKKDRNVLVKENTRFEVQIDQMSRVLNQCNQMEV